MHRAIAAAAACMLAIGASAQAASGTVSSLVLPTPSVAPGFKAQLVADGLTTPRGIIFDNTDRLLTVQRGTGVVGLTFSEASNGTVRSNSSDTIVEDETLNHGIALSSDSRTLYASSTESVFSWAYDPATGETMSEPTILVTNMTTSDHTTRTLLLSQKAPGMLLVTLGSTSNIDPEASDITTGHSQIKAFNITNMTGAPYDFTTAGLLLGWGLRNDVGIAEEPIMGGIYSVENSVDQMERLGQDIHATNPAEELNYLGTMMDNTSPNQGTNFGYPECYTAWDTSVIPQSQGLEVGMQFTIADSGVNDTLCQQERTPPRLAFESHMAPLDIKFDTNGTIAYVSFHGSWNRSPLTPSGYKISAIPFTGNGEPVAPSTSQTGYVDIVSNQDNAACPDDCFRPVGLAWDSKGRLFFSSDSTGQIYMITSNSSIPNDAVDGAPIPAADQTSSEGDSTGSGGAMQGSNVAAEQFARSLLYVGLAAVAVAAFMV